MWTTCPFQIERQQPLQVSPHPPNRGATCYAPSTAVAALHMLYARRSILRIELWISLGDGTWQVVTGS